MSNKPKEPKTIVLRLREVDNERLNRFSAEWGVTRSQVVRLLLHAADTTNRFNPIDTVPKLYRPTAKEEEEHGS